MITTSHHPGGAHNQERYEAMGDEEYPTSQPGDEEYPTSTFFDGDAEQAREAGYADGRHSLGEQTNLTGADPEMVEAYKAGHSQGMFGSEPAGIGPISNEEFDRRLKENEEREAAEELRKRTEELHDELKHHIVE